jgi:hypothetical protein
MSRAVHFREEEPAEFGGAPLSAWLACETGDRDWRYSRPDGSAANVSTTRNWAAVTCKFCLRKRPVVLRRIEEPFDMMRALKDKLGERGEHIAGLPEKGTEP